MCYLLEKTDKYHWFERKAIASVNSCRNSQAWTHIAALLADNFGRLSEKPFLDVWGTECSLLLRHSIRLMPHIGVQFLCVDPAVAACGFNGIHNGFTINQVNDTYLAIGLRRESNLTEPIEFSIVNRFLKN